MVKWGSSTFTRVIKEVSTSKVKSTDVLDLRVNKNI